MALSVRCCFAPAPAGLSRSTRKFMPIGVALKFPAFARSRPVRMAFQAVRSLFRSEQSAARLHAEIFRGRRSAAMTYAQRAITDHFRRIDHDRLLGLMEMRGMERPYFFLLTRDESLGPVTNVQDVHQ